MMNRFDKPYRLLSTYDPKKILELFNIVNDLDTNDLLRFSLANQISFDVTNEDGDCLIHEVINIDNRKASQHVKLNIIKFLVQNGVNPDTPNKMNQTPLHLACHLQLDLIVKYLLEINVNPNYIDNLGLYPFHYLFLGEIKPVDNTSEVLDFVVKKKIETTNTKELLEIKKILWDFIKEEPFLKTINNTINELIKADENGQINDRVEKIYDLFDELRKADANVQKSPMIIKDIEAFNKGINKKIEEKFGGFKDLSNIRIHSTGIDSWNPDSITQSRDSLIEDANYKKKIKKDILAAMDAIKTLRDEYRLIDYKIPDRDDYILYLNGLKNKEIMNKKFEFNGNIYYYLTQLEDINNELRYKEKDKKETGYVVDNASSKIDFTNLTYLGGSRLIIPNNIKYVNNNIIDEFKKIYSHESSDQKILYLLDNRLTSDEIIFLEEKLNSIHITYKFDYYKSYTEIKYILNNCIEIFGVNNTYNLSNYDKFFNMNYALCVLMSFIAIKYQSNINEELINALSYHDINNNNPFLIKWSNKFINNKVDTGLWIYEMYCDLLCSTSQDNLNCTIPFTIIALVTGIKNQSTDIIQGVYNIYRPHLIYELIKIHPRVMKPEIIKTNCLLLFLNENMDNDFLDEMFKNKVNEDYINNLNINDDLKLFSKLIYRYTNDKKQFINDIDKVTKDEPQKYYAKFNKINLKVMDVFRTIILSIYNQLKNKPLKQTLFDFIYLLNKNDVAEFQRISILWFMNDTNPNKYYFDLSKDDNQPSYLGFNNLIIDNSSELNKDKDIIHFAMAHLMGLYYEGVINKQSSDEFNKNDKLYANYHNNTIATNTIPFFDDNTLPLPLNYLVLKPMDYSTPYNYYNVIKMPFRLPTNNNVNKTYYDKATKYQIKIQEQLNNVITIINELAEGNSSNLKTLYTVIYPTIVNLNRLLEHFCTNIKCEPNNTKLTKELANNLNKINSLYYIYYYLKTIELDTKTIKIERFNYYLLDYKISKYYDYRHEFKETPMIGGKYLYDNIKELYDKHNYGTEYIEPNKLLLKPNNVNLSPSLFNDLSTFYNYGLVETIKHILSKLDLVTYPPLLIISEIISNLDKYVESLKLSVDDPKLVRYFIIAKLIEELVRDQTKWHINDAVVRYYKDGKLKFVKVIDSFIKIKEFSVNLTSVVLDFERIDDASLLKNMYSVIKKSKKSDDFIIYPNDFTNTSKFKLKYSFYINEKIIKILLDNNSLLFKINIENNTPIYSLLKINNNKIMNELQIHLNSCDMKINDFEDENKNHLSFITKEYENNLNKILHNYNQSYDSINKVFNNINGYLYNDIKTLIISNENFGNNILLYLDDSFSMCSYLTLQYLGEHLINIDTEFTMNDLKDILSLINCDIKNINKNYLGENLRVFEIEEDDDIFIAQQILNEKLIDFNKIKQVIRELEVIRLQFNDKDLRDKFNRSDKIIFTENKYAKLIEEIKALEELIKGNDDIRDNHSSKLSKIIKRYDELEYEYPIMCAWSKLLKEPIFDNYNLLLIVILLIQKEFLNDKRYDDLQIFDKMLKHISNLCEDYFTKKNIIAENSVLGFIYDMLVYLTKIILCNGIEYTMRRILFTFYTNQSNDNLIFINDRINNVIEGEIKDLGKSLHDILFNDISKRLVKSSTNIYQDKDDELINESTRDILTEFFDHLKVFPELNDVKLIFDSEVISYFDTFISRTILLWMVNTENIFKFFINNYRTNNILLLLK